MSNFKELLFMENDEWVQVTAQIEVYKEEIRKCIRHDDPRFSVELDDYLKDIYYMALDREYERRRIIEENILSKYNLRAMATRGSLESTDEDSMIRQIVKHGYLKGFKF